MTIFMLIMLLAIVASLGLAGWAMVGRSKTGAPNQRRMVRALTWRIGLSVLLFLLVMLAYFMGWIQPTGIPAGR